MIETERLLLLPYTYELVEATLKGKSELESILGYRVSEEWPNAAYAKTIPEKKEKLKENRESSMWSRIVIEKDSRTLIGEIGCKGGPDANGVVEIGYGIVPSARNHGFATEMVQGLVGWLSTHPTVKKVIAECLETNAPSAKVLEKSGFQKINTAGGRIHWENFK